MNNNKENKIKQTIYRSMLSPEVLTYNILYHMNSQDTKDKGKAIQSVIKTFIQPYKVEEDISNNVAIDDEIDHNNKLKEFRSLMGVDEFVNLIEYNNKLIAIGLDSFGQSYFVVYKDEESGELVTNPIGTYVADVDDYIEWRFGEPTLCDKYNDGGDETSCEHRGSKGYCDRCKKYDYREYQYQKLLSLGVVDRKGNVVKEFEDIIQIK